MPWNVSALIRAAACLAAGVVLLKFTALNEHLQLRAEGWAMLALFEGLLIAGAARIFLKDAKSSSPDVLHLDTRNVDFIRETVISGGAAMFAFFALLLFVGAGSNEVWAGTVETGRGPKTGELIIGAFFGVVAFFGLFWRPTFTLDLAKRTIRRYPFGRALPFMVGPERSTSDVRIRSEGFFITNRGIRLGDMVRGVLGKNTFELELVRAPASKEQVEARAEYWRGALGI